MVVGDRLEAELAQLALDRRPDTGQNVDGALEPLGARDEARPLPPRGAVERGEGSQRPRRKGVCLCQRPFTSCMSQISFASQRIIAETNVISRTGIATSSPLTTNANFEHAQIGQLAVRERLAIGRGKRDDRRGNLCERGPERRERER